MPAAKLVQLLTHL